MSQPLDPLLQEYVSKITYAHIRQRIEQLWSRPQSVVDYINELLLDTRDGQRRGFDWATADLLFNLKLKLLQSLGEYEKLKDNTNPEGDFTTGEVNPYRAVKLPKGW
ncbi:MAG: hypothetical protein RMK34_09965 [Tepidimonas sp.]|uniref:hypothetical protein n=1 Tax=Tepidimonas sp. TaxID=2002775 RepID=UPI00298F14E3|nr:hypothetical protein [Tepidimonas sp.]MCS6809830.1 hypothetical protein [Tepidimonas sp.]MDW8337276.1 hypothetical protein [Tepidimonas sp.]